MGKDTSVKRITKKETANKKEVRVTVEEIENGFLLIKNVEWYDAKNNWQHKTIKTYSKTDPLKDAKIVDAKGKEKSLSDYF